MSLSVVDSELVARNEFGNPATALAAATGSDGLVISVLRTDAELAAIGEEWNQLAEQVPFRQWEWLEAWWRFLKRPADVLFVLLLRDGAGNLVGLAPWFITRSPWFGRVVRFLGSGIVCTDYLTVMCAPGRRDNVTTAIGDWLTTEGRDQWDAIELEAVECGDPAAAQIVEYFQERRHRIATQGVQSCWRVELPDRWEAYLPTLAETQRRKARKLIRELFDKGRATARWAESAEDFERGWRILVDLHQRRRRSLGQPGCFALPRFEDFLKLAAARFLKQGKLRLQWIELDGRPVAVELDVVGGDTVYLYQSGIDPDVIDQQPGWLGTIAALRRATSEGIRYFDFMRGDEIYKSRWRGVRRPLVTYRIAGHSGAARVRQRLWCGRAAAKQWAKRFLAGQKSLRGRFGARLGGNRHGKQAKAGAG